MSLLNKSHKISCLLWLITVSWIFSCGPTLLASDQDSSSSDSSSLLLDIDGIPELVVLFGRRYRGIRLNRVGQEGMVQKAGLEPGDVLLSLNSINIHSKEESEKALQSIPTGNLSLVFARLVNGQYKLIENKVNYTNPRLSNVLKTKLVATDEDQQVLEERMIALINSDRRDSGYNLQLLRMDPLLTQLARNHAEDMSKRHYFSHVTPEGLNAQMRARAIGIKGAIAENLLSGALTVEEAQEEFMDEPTSDPHNHRANILNPAFRNVGVGIARNYDHTLLIVQEFD